MNQKPLIFSLIIIHQLLHLRSHSDVFQNQIVIKETPTLELNGRKGAIIKVRGCGLCGSDIVKFIHKISKDGTVLGHEIVGEIVELNTKTPFKIGDIIVSSHHIPCGECVYCRNGNVSMCEHFKSTNIVPGGFSEYIYLTEEHLENVAHIKPENLTDVEASYYEPLGCCVRAIKRAQLKGNSTALVVGLGSIGIIMAQALKAFGMDVTGCDLLPERVQMLRDLGISAINVKELNPNLQADGVFMTSGSDKAINTALKFVRNGGKIVVFSSTPSNWGYANNEIYYRELSVIGSYSPAPVDLADSLNLLRSKQVKVENLSTVYDFKDIQEAFDDTLYKKIMKAYIRISK